MRLSDAGAVFLDHARSILGWPRGCSSWGELDSLVSSEQDDAPLEAGDVRRLVRKGKPKGWRRRAPASLRAARSCVRRWRQLEKHFALGGAYARRQKPPSRASSVQTQPIRAKAACFAAGGECVVGACPSGVSLSTSCTGGAVTPGVPLCCVPCPAGSMPDEDAATCTPDDASDGSAGDAETDAPDVTPE